MCAQRRLRSAWASAQYDQRLRCSHEKAWVLSYLLSAQRRLWSDWTDAQADLSIRWVQMPFCWLCHFTGNVSSQPQIAYRAAYYWQQSVVWVLTISKLDQKISFLFQKHLIVRVCPVNYISVMSSRLTERGRKKRRIGQVKERSRSPTSLPVRLDLSCLKQMVAGSTFRRTGWRVCLSLTILSIILPFRQVKLWFNSGIQTFKNRDIH